MANDEADQEFYRRVGVKIRSARENLHISQEELGRRVGLLRTSVTNIEKGRQRLFAHTLWALARALAIPVEGLFPASGEPYEEALLELPVKHRFAVKAALRETEEDKT